MGYFTVMGRKPNAFNLLIVLRQELNTRFR